MATQGALDLSSQQVYSPLKDVNPVVETVILLILHINSSLTEVSKTFTTGRERAQ